MTALTKTQVAQDVKTAEFVFNYNDTMTDIAGVTRDFGSLAGGSSAATAYVFEIIDLPAGAVVVGGEVFRTTAFDTAGYDLFIGDSVTADRYLGTADLKAQGTTALVPTGYVTVGNPIRISISTDDACTTGVCVVRVNYIIRGSADYVTG